MSTVRRVSTQLLRQCRSLSHLKKLYLPQRSLHVFNIHQGNSSLHIPTQARLISTNLTLNSTFPANSNSRDLKQIGEVTPRLMLSYKCKVCNSTNTETFARKSYEEGVVIVTCQTCKNHHLIADNLGWFTDVEGRNIEEILAAKGEEVRKLNSLDISSEIMDRFSDSAPRDNWHAVGAERERTGQTFSRRGRGGGFSGSRREMSTSASAFDRGSEESDDVVRLDGIPWTSQEQDIEQFFSGLEIAQGGIHLPLDRRGRPLGRAYVRFVSPEDATEALKRNKQHIGKRYVEVYRSTVDEIGSVMRQGREPPKDTSVVEMKGLPWSCTEDQIAEFFHGLEIVPDGVNMLLTREGRPLGKAFVQFASPSVAMKAMSRNRNNIGQRYIELFMVTEAEAMTHARMAKDKSSVVRMNGLPWEVEMDQITDFFSGFEIAPGGIHLGLNRSGRPSGSALVQFVSPDVASNALSKDKQLIGSRYIDLSMSSQGAIDAQRTKLSSTIVKVKGLPFKYYEDEIADFFTGFDLPTSAIHLCYNRDRNDGSHNGICYVEFASPELARGALQLDRDQRWMGGRSIVIYKSDSEELSDEMYYQN